LNLKLFPLASIERKPTQKRRVLLPGNYKLQAISVELSAISFRYNPLTADGFALKAIPSSFYVDKTDSKASGFAVWKL
jgi:hypothetical protein